MSNNIYDLDNTIEEAHRTIHLRLAEEIDALPMKKSLVALWLGCGESLLHTWLRGDHRPNAYYLAKLYFLGCDIVYILTGIHTQGGDFDV